MSNWEHELEMLLNRLGVHWEPLPPHEPGVGADGAGAAELVMMEDVDLEPENWEGLEDDDLDQLGVVRREIQATIGRVTRMVRAGQLDSAIRDDVLFVLRALCRSQPPDEGENEEEAQLATAAAILHFCRIVLRLTHALAQQ